MYLVQRILKTPKNVVQKIREMSPIFGKIGLNTVTKEMSHNGFFSPKNPECQQKLLC